DTVAVIPDSAENAAAATPDSGAIQTADTASAAKAAEFLNPFASGGESALPGSVGVSESDTAVQARHSDGKRCRYKTVLMSGMALQQLPVDLFLDVSMGFGFSRFDVESPFYSTRGDADFIFDLGVVFPFRRVFFAKAAVRSLQLAYAISDSTADFMGSYFTTRADEWLHYLSLPMSVGCKFTIGPCSPYIFVRCEPAYLTSSHEVVERKSFTLFLPDSSTYTIVSVADNQTTDRRARGQVFVGGGGGVELSYGYGYLYIDGGVQIALIQTGYRDVSPEHAKSLFWIFPISAGLRFYL
ncbi:MAG: hypothetical protein JW768_13990, partial [Chitinispirillaceae bacterium]|nr:hypothetical protein [Chitinispirillaceae bacterium]